MHTKKQEKVIHMGESSSREYIIITGISVGSTGLSEMQLYPLNIREFVYFVWGLSPPKCRVVYDGEILHADAYRPFAKHLLGFMFTGVVVTKNDIFQKLPSRRPTVLQRWWVGRLAAAGWLQPRPVLLTVSLFIAQALAAAGWLQ